MITFTRCAFMAKQACTTFSQVVQKITPPIANNFLKFFFALFATLTLNAATAWGATYTKVTSAPSDWSGEYLIVYESGKVVFDGSLTTLDAASNTQTVTIANNTITLDSKYSFTISKSGANYTIKSASGKYIGNNSNSNALSSSTSSLNNTISFSSANDITIKSSGGAYLRYNSASNQLRFRYYKSSSYTGQKAICLYKKVDVPQTVAVTGVSLNKTSLTLTEGDSETLTATITPADATDKTITWSTSNANFATVSNGKVTAVAEGSATITAKTKDGNKTATCDVTVNPKPKYTVTLVPGSGSVTDIELEEESAGAGVELPEPTLDCGDWKFAGWAISPVEEEQTEAPNFITDKPYKPSGNITLYAVYQRTDDGGGNSTPTSVTKEFSGANNADLKFTTGSSSNHLVNNTGYTAGDANVKFTTGTNNNNSYYDGSVVRFYAGSSMIITPLNGVTITRVEIVRSSSTGSNSGTISADNLTASNSNSTINTNVFTGSSTTAVTFKNSAQCRFTALNVTYTSSSGGSTTYYHSTPQCTTQTTITLKPNGGTGDDETYTTEKTSYTLPACPFSRTGYTFAGWAKSRNGEIEHNDKAELTELDGTPVVLYAQWTANSYTVIFNANGGTGEMDNQSFNYDEEKALSANEFTRKGHTFVNWNNNYDGSGDDFDDEQEVKNLSTINRGTYNLYAQWECVTPTISTQPQSATYLRDDDADALSVVAAASDATLTYQWQKSTDNSTWSDITGATEATYKPSTQSVGTTYYRVVVTNSDGNCSATSDVATIAVRSANCKWVETDIANINSGDEVVVTMTKSGYTYAMSNNRGTTIAPEAIVITVKDGIINEVVETYNQWTIVKDNNYLVFYADATNRLYGNSADDGLRVGSTNNAKTNHEFFIAGNYLVNNVTSRYVGVNLTKKEWYSYNTNTGKIVDQTLIFYKKECLPLGEYWINYDLTNVVCTDDPIKNKISTDEDAVELNFEATGEHNELPRTIIVTNGSTTLTVNTDYTWNNATGVLTLNPSQITDNITISIAAQKRKYTVTFDANGHGTAPAAQSVTAEGTASEPTAPEATGYTFGGWYKESECENEFDFNTAITGNITLTAKWKIITYNITYEGLEGATHSNPSTYNVETATITFTTPSNREDYVFKGWTPASIAKGSTGDKTVTAQWIKAHTVTWKGATYNGTQNVVNGDAVGTLPEDVACSDTYTTFIGWYTKSSGVETNPSAEPQGEEVTAETQPTKDVTYYAVWADGSGNTSTVDELTRETTGVSGTSYTSWSGKTSNSLAVYAGQSAGGNDAIQLRSNNSNSGIITTTSGGKATKVSVTWNINTADDRTLNVYGKNTAYSSPTDLYGDAAGTLIGTIVRGTSTELTISGDYEYIGLRSASGAMYLDEIQITWSSGVDPTGYISSCCQSQAVVTVAPQTTELALNIDGTASTNVHISQEGAGNGKYNQPTISPAELSLIHI